MKTYIEKTEEGYIVVDKVKSEYVTFSKRKNAETFRKFIDKFAGDIEQRFNSYADAFMDIYHQLDPTADRLHIIMRVEKDLF